MPYVVLQTKTTTTIMQCAYKRACVRSSARPVAGNAHIEEGSSCRKAYDNVYFCFLRFHYKPKPCQEMRLVNNRCLGRLFVNINLFRQSKEKGNWAYQ